MNDDTANIAAVAKALGHPARVQIVELLARQSECMGAEVFSELPLAQSTISEHLRILRDAGLVSATPLGTRTLYCLRHKTLDDFAVSVAGLAGLAATCDTKGCR